MPHTVRMRRLLLVAVAALALTGCVVMPPQPTVPPVPTSAVDPTPAVDPAPSVEAVPVSPVQESALAPATVAWSADALLVSTPVVVGDVALAYESDGGSALSATAWSSTGERLWSVTAATLADGPLPELVPLGEAADATVPVLVPTDDGDVRWSVLDVRTGIETVWSTRSPDGSATSWPEVFETWRCLPEETASSMCFSVDDGTGASLAYLRVDVGRGIELAPLWTRAGIYASDLGLYLEEGSSDLLLLSEGGRRWTVPWSEAFTTEPVGSGIRAELVDDVLVVASNPGWYDATFEGTAVDVAAIHAVSGAVLWRRPATSPCGVDGSVAVLCSLDATVDPYAPNVALRGLTVHGVDVATGEERWTHETSAAAIEQATGTDSWQRWGSGDLVALVDDRTVVLDAATGDRFAIDPTAARPCTIAGGLVASWGSWEDLADIVRWCDASVVDQRLAAAVGTTVTASDGTTLALVVEELALVAYRIG